MNQDKAAAQASAEDEERAKVHKAQEVVERISASVAQVCLIILTLLAIVYTLYFGAGIILPFVLALVLATVLGPAMRLMNRRLHIPRMIAALLLIIALFSVVGALGYALSVPASAWIAKAPQSLPPLMDKLSFLRRPPAGPARRARAAKCDVARRTGAGGPAGCDREATVRRQ